MTLCSAILLRTGNVALWINRMIMCLGNGPEREEEVRGYGVEGQGAMGARHAELRSRTWREDQAQEDQGPECTKARSVSVIAV